MKLIIVCVLVVTCIVLAQGAAPTKQHLQKATTKQPLSTTTTKKPVQGCIDSDGKFVKEGERVDKGCDSCSCDNGQMACLTIECYLDDDCPGGAKPEYRRGECCPSCS